MFAAISNFFGVPVTKFEQSQAQVSWDEKLDEAIYKIERLREIDSDEGKEKLGLILDDLRLFQMETQMIKNEAEKADKVIVFYDLPWEGLPSHQALCLTKEIFALGVDENSLLMHTDELQYEFNFNMDHYIILAQIMIKLDLNLKKTRHELVPELISEDHFWRNYFYKIEFLKFSLGVRGNLRLGRRIIRVKAVDEADVEAGMS